MQFHDPIRMLSCAKTVSKSRGNRDMFNAIISVYRAVFESQTCA